MEEAELGEGEAGASKPAVGIFAFCNSEPEREY